jgi:outer membrane protein assembly factor BamD (BamD/ComL family)
LDSIIGNSEAGLVDYALLLKSDILLKQQDKAQAIAILQKLKEESEERYIQAEAIYKIAGLETNPEEKTKALELYKTLVTDYPGSVYSVEAAKQYRDLEKTNP